MISLTIKDKDFNRQMDKLAKKHSKQLYEAVVVSTNKMHKLAVHNAPVDDGTLRREIKQDITRAGEFTGTVDSNAAYSQAVEEGTKPHVIEIKSKKVLAGAARKAPAGMPTNKGWAVYGPRVQHPGTKPQPFMHPAFNVAVKYLYKQIGRLF